MKLRHYIAIASTLAGSALGIWLALREPAVEGTIAREDLFEPHPGFGLIYRIELTMPQGERRPYVFVGETVELRELDRTLNVGDVVNIRDRGGAYSLDLEKVLTPDWITKD